MLLAHSPPPTCREALVLERGGPIYIEGRRKRQISVVPKSGSSSRNNNITGLDPQNLGTPLITILVWEFPHFGVRNVPKRVPKFMSLFKTTSLFPVRQQHRVPKGVPKRFSCCEFVTLSFCLCCVVFCTAFLEYTQNQQFYGLAP